MKSRVNNSKNKKQHGGTILGLVIGLVVGLAIAVVVAVMITKTSTPFTNKLGMTKPADTLPIQVIDPNKPLYGNAYKEPPANRPAAERAPETEIANVDTTNESTENAMKYPDAESVPETVKLSPKSADNAANKSAVKKSADEKAAYYLQVGAFREASDAESVRAKLALIGVESDVSGKNSEGDGLYRVRIGPFEQTDEMNRMRSKLVENSIDVAVIKTPK